MVVLPMAAAQTRMRARMIGVIVIVLALRPQRLGGESHFHASVSSAASTIVSLSGR